MYKSYRAAIKNKDIEQLFSIFAENLNIFNTEADRIIDEWNDVAEQNVDENVQLRLKYNKVWMDFVNLFPKSLLCTKYIDEQGCGSLDIKDIMRGGTIDGYGRNTSDVVRAIAEYVVYILVRNNNYTIQIAIWDALYFVAHKINLTSLTVKPRDVVKEVDKAYSKIIHNNIYKPVAYFCQGKLFDHKLSSSAQVGLFRLKVLRGFLKDFLRDHKLPTREEVAEYLVDRCRNSPDKRLWLFRDGIGDRTLRKVLQGYTNLLCRKQRKWV